jgi:hypothetical protein
MVNWYGLGVASFICVVLPIWMIGWTIIPFNQKILFTVVALGVCWYAVEKGGFKKGLVMRN